MDTKMKKDKIYTNTFYYYANEYRKNITDENELEKIDCTQMFEKETDLILQQGELLNININAPPTSGKSITGMAIANKKMKKHYKRPFTIKDLDRDQQEFSKTMRNPKLANTIRVIDEWNTMETTGENSSVEGALYDYMSDVMAQRMIHKISCSPKDQTDKNALIFLEVYSTDKINQTNYCKLYYKITQGGIEHLQLLGYIKVSVKEILKQPWYKEYRRRKIQKWELMLKEGITKPRELEYAQCILEVIQKLKKLAMLTNTVTKDIIGTYVKSSFRKQKIPLSIIGEEFATRRANGILTLYNQLQKIKKEIENINLKLTSNQRKNTKLLIERKNELQETVTTAGESIKEQLNELERHQQIANKLRPFTKDKGYLQSQQQKAIQNYLIATGRVKIKGYPTKITITEFMQEQEQREDLMRQTLIQNIQEDINQPRG